MFFAGNPCKRPVFRAFCLCILHFPYGKCKENAVKMHKKQEYPTPSAESYTQSYTRNGL